MKCQAGYLEAFSYLACAKTFQDRLDSESLVDPSLYIPTIMLISLSVEVFLKTIHIEESRPKRKFSNSGHSLIESFDYLEKSCKDFLSLKIGFEISTLEERIKSADSSFKDWRYLYEPKEHNSLGYSHTVMTNIAEALCMYLEEKYHYKMTSLIVHNNRYQTKTLIGNSLIRNFDTISVPEKISENSFRYRILK